MSGLAELLIECEALGVRLSAGDDGLTIDAPEGALSDNLLARLKGHKAELLAHLGPEGARLPHRGLREPLKTTESITPTSAVCRCGSTSWRDVPAHQGRSVRRDCARCGQFIDFPIWTPITLDNSSSNG